MKNPKLLKKINPSFSPEVEKKGKKGIRKIKINSDLNIEEESED